MNASAIELVQVSGGGHAWFSSGASLSSSTAKVALDFLEEAAERQYGNAKTTGEKRREGEGAEGGAKLPPLLSLSEVRASLRRAAAQAAKGSKLSSVFDSGIGQSSMASARYARLPLDFLHDEEEEEEEEEDEDEDTDGGQEHHDDAYDEHDGTLAEDFSELGRLLEEYAAAEKDGLRGPQAAADATTMGEGTVPPSSSSPAPDAPPKQSSSSSSSSSDLGEL